MENVDGAVENCRTFLVLYAGVECGHIILSKYEKSFMNVIILVGAELCTNAYKKKRGNKTGNFAK